MGFTEDYLKLRNKRQKEKEKETDDEVQKVISTGPFKSFKMQASERGDIAPVTRQFSQAAGENRATDWNYQERETERTWFDSGAFDDGYQFGDVTKTILGSGVDLLENIGSGIMGMGEAAVDAFATISPYVMQSQMSQAPVFDEKLRQKQESLVQEAIGETEEFVAKDLYDEREVAKAIITNPFRDLTGIDAEKDSVFGEKSDSLVQSAGQLAATFGLQMAGVPWFVTTGVTSFGSEAENALQQGASLAEANASGFISAGAEVLSEKLFGGDIFVKGAGADMATTFLSTAISNKTWRTLAKFGMDMTGEGVEEVFSQFVSNLGSSLYKEKDLGEILFDEEALDGYIESFVGGSVLGGGMSGINVVKSNKAGVDYVTELTKNEQAVVDKVYQDRVAEAEENGKISQAEKGKIYNEVLNEMEKGYISTDTIEEVLGGEEYANYTQTKQTEEALRQEYDSWKQEYDELYEMKLGEKSSKQVDREAELKNLLEQRKKLLDTSPLENMRSRMGESVFSIVSREMKGQGSRLMESYNERARRGQAFEADLSQYDQKQQAVIQKAIDSGILNNTNRTHEFVDMVAKISADKGVLFDFTNNEKLKNSGFAVDGKFVNGYVTKDGVTVNIQSQKALNSIVGHEITHVLEGTEFYDTLSEAVKNYAIAKEGLESFNKRLKSTEGLYKGMDAEVDKEIVADLVGDYLFTDSEFINRLSTEHRNIFQKMYDEVKYLYKVATAGSKEARELEKVKKAFEEAYRAGNKAKGDTKYSLTDVEPVQPKSGKWARTHTTAEAMEKFPNMWNVAAEESEVRNPTQIVSTVNSYRKIYNFLQNEGFNGTILDASSGLGYGTKAGIEEYGFNVEDIEPYPDKSYNPKYQDYSALDKKYDVIISNAVLNVLPQDQRDALAVKMGELLNEGGRLFVNVRGKDVESLAKTGKNIHLGNMEWIETVKGSYQKGFTKPELVAYLQDALGDGFTVKPTNMFGAVSAVVTKNGAKYSISDGKYGDRSQFEVIQGYKPRQTDSDGKGLTDEQMEYFKDSKMRDEKGNLKVMYHGSENAGFHVFDSRMSDDDTSFFFTDRNDVAQSYSGTSEVYEARTIRSAKDMNNFLAEIGEEDYRVVEENGKFTLYQENEYVAESDTAQGIYEEFCDWAGVGYGDANYKVYLNLKNPLVVDAQGRNWDRISGEFSQEIYDRIQSLTAEEKAALHDLAGWEDSAVFRDELQTAVESVERGASYVDDHIRNLASAAEKLGNTDMYRLFDIATDNFSEESLRENAVQYLKTRDYAQRAKEQGYDGVIFNNIVDNGGYADGTEGASTVAIAFDSNQVKSTANAKPTGDADIRYSLSSIANTFFGDENMSANEFMRTDYTQTQGYRDYVEQCVNNYRQSRGADFDEATARKGIEDSIRGIVRVAVAAKQAGYDIHDDARQRNTKDSKDRLLFSSLEPNSDYITSNDLSTICDKRKNFADIYDAIVKAEEAKGVPAGKRFFDNVDNYFYLHKLMADKGLTQPCRQCYVESMRKNLAPMATAFLDLVKETNPNNTKNAQLYHQSGKNKGQAKTSNTSTREWVLASLAEYGMSPADLSVETLTTEDGLAQLKITAPMVYEAFNSFYGQAKPKMPKAATPFRFGELTALLTDEKGRIKQSLVDKINHTGGFRLQSYSDFQIQNYTDVLQVLFEAGTLGLRGHAYTKVPAFLTATEGTNLKRNISIFMYKDGNEWKLDRNDSFPYTLEEIYDIVNADDSGNTGIIAVSQNDDMSAWIMANDNVGYGIPFHKSGLKMGVVRDTIVKEGGREIKGYSGAKDHTKQQSEVWKTTTADHKANTKVKKGIDIYEFWDFINSENLSKNELIEKNVKRYIDECEKAGYLPKFRDYVMNNSRVLNNVLEYSKKLGFAPADATIEDISFQYKGYTIPYGYYKFLGDFGMFKPDGTASSQEVLSLENYDFDKAVKFFEDSETLRRNEILQQFANGDERERYRQSNLTAEQLQDIVKRKRGEIAEGVVNRHNRFAAQDLAPAMSLSEVGEEQKSYGTYNVYGKDVALEAPVAENAPVPETVSEMESVAPEMEATTEESPVVAENATTTEELFPDEGNLQAELDSLYQQKETLEGRMTEAMNSEDLDAFTQANTEYDEVMTRIEELESEISETESARADSLTDADVPPETEPLANVSAVAAEDPFAERSESAVGNRSVKAYQYENPEVRPFFQEAAYGLMDDINDSTPAERWYNDQLYYESGGEKGFGGNKRHTTADIADFKDAWGCSWDDLREAVQDIIEDHGKENNALSKRVEFLINDRLMYGYTNIRGEHIRPNQAYLDFLKEKQITEYSAEARENFFANADQYAPYEAPVAPVSEVPAAPVEDIAPVQMATETVNTDSKKGVIKGQQTYITTEDKLKRANSQPKALNIAPMYEAHTSKGGQVKGQQSLLKSSIRNESDQVAKVLTEEPAVEAKKSRWWSWLKNNVFDRGMVFEDVALKEGNRELQAKWNSTRYAEGKAQKFMTDGADGVKSLQEIRETVESSGKTKAFFDYLYHQHNVDRMTLEERFGVENKTVFGDTVTADVSKTTAEQLAKANPEFKEWSKDVYRYMNHLRKLMVDYGIISRETAYLWARMYPHYVPVGRVGHTGLNINVPLDTGRTGVNAPIKKAVGGSSDIRPLFTVMGERTIQTFKAIAKNSFGVELKNTLGTTIEQTAANLDETIDSIDNHDELLKKGEKGKNPTFTVFENGKRVTFEITEEMYDAMKPAEGIVNETIKPLNIASNIFRGLVTEYNPTFMLTNPIKDAQDVLINSQHPLETYMAIPKALAQMASNGHYYEEYLNNGGEQNSYFDDEQKTFSVKKVPAWLEVIGNANNAIERLPRLAEYIASREAGASIDVAMLDAARVTTNFAAGGAWTKFLNRNGATFLNASMQGAVQQVRNIREAKVNGVKGWVKLATKALVAGIPAMVLNHLLWDDDEEYQEISDYVKQNYYIVGKYDDGKFIRIPKGRTVAVIQNAFEQMENLITGDDEVDLGTFLELAISNLAPNNPLDNNIFAPIAQVAGNRTWYGEDLIPTRLQDLPAAEQYDESTDEFSKWLGGLLNYSPYKINYLLNQYGGGLADIALPMMTPEAESDDSSFLGTIAAPFRDKFTTDSVLNNQNVSEFYDLKDELTINANSMYATDEDMLKSKYMNSINSEISELYQQKREIQNSDLSDEEKYEAVRDIQQQIVDLMKGGMSSYEDITFEDDYRVGGEYARIGDRVYKRNEDGEWAKLSDDQLTKYEVTKAAGDAAYASDGENHYRWYEKDGEGEWRKITDDQLEKQEEVTSGLHISPEEYWENKEEYDYAYESPENYAIAKSVGGYEAYRTYSSEMYDIKADKDENGKSISGSRKEKVWDYISSLDISDGEKYILFKNEYNADDAYNYEIIDYLNRNDAISYEDMVAILKKLGFTVDSQGNISWD